MKASFRKSTIFLLIVLCTDIGIVSAAKRRKTRISAILKDVEVCNDDGNTKLNYTFHGKDDYRINVSVDIKEPLVDVQFKNEFGRCEVQSDNCENFLNVPMDDFCEFLVKKDDGVWSLLLKEFEPELLCPLQGTYALKEYRILELVKKMTELGALDAKSDRYHYTWKMQIQHKPTKRDILCIYVKAYLKQIRVS